MHGFEDSEPVPYEVELRNRAEALISEAFDKLSDALALADLPADVREFIADAHTASDTALRALEEWAK